MTKKRKESLNECYDEVWNQEKNKSAEQVLQSLADLRKQHNCHIAQQNSGPKKRNSTKSELEKKKNTEKR